MSPSVAPVLPAEGLSCDESRLLPGDANVRMSWTQMFLLTLDIPLFINLHSFSCQPSVEQEEIFKKDEEITVKTVVKKLFDMTSARGKRGTDRSDQISEFSLLSL